MVFIIRPGSTFKFPLFSVSMNVSEQSIPYYILKIPFFIFGLRLYGF